MKVKAFSAILATGAIAAPFTFPLPDGFPNPSNQSLAAISKSAGGPLPNSAPLKSLSPAAINRLKLVAANELFETAYFSSLLANVTNQVPGYQLNGFDNQYVISSLKRIVAQEELHAYGANSLLQDVGEPPVAPCQYTFPVANFRDAISHAATFTDVVMGTLPELQYVAGTQGGSDDKSLIPLFGIVIANEGEQNGWFRSMLGKYPSAGPYMTASIFEFAASVGYNFATDSACPNSTSTLAQTIKPLPSLTVTKQPTLQSLSVTYTLNGTVDPTNNGLVYISGQNVPLTVPFGNVTTNNGLTTFTASFPAGIKTTNGFQSGLTFATVTKGKGPYANVTDVANNTLFGPGIIEFDF